MSNPGLANMDAAIFATFLRAGLGDQAFYSDGISSISCAVIVERDVQVLGEYGQVVGAKTTIGFKRSEVPAPKRGATCTVGSKTWTLESKLHEDESVSEWYVNG